MSLISENDLLEAIAECQGQRNPNAQTCIKLAAYYTILDNMRASDTPVSRSSYSYSASGGNETAVEYISNTDFAKIINGKSANKMWSIVDELMSTIAFINPKLYNDAMHKFSE